MTRNLNKLQIRAEILNAIKQLECGDKHTQEFLQQIVAPLKEIEDKGGILDVLIREIISSTNDSRFFVLSYLLETLIPKGKLEEELWRYLNLPNITDMVKANIINILKDLGNQINYEKYSEYFENPDAVIDADTEKMLKSAISNPEALIDFLDFIEALPQTDRSILIDSLCEDYNGDELANLFSPVLYALPNSDLCKYAIKRLGESKSTLAIQPLNFILNFSQDEEIRAIAKKALVSLKLSGAREDNADKFYQKVLAESKIEDVFISMPDGYGNVGILLSRKRYEKDSLQMFAVVFNDKSGILDCFGFNDITESEFLRIVNKFYANQEKICISPSVAKLLLNNAQELSLKNHGKVSYEYICWKRIIEDIQLPKEDVEAVLSKKLEKIPLTADVLLKVYNTAIFDKWFLYNSDNQSFDLLLKEVTEILRTNKDAKKALEEIKLVIRDFMPKIWTEQEIMHIDYRLLLSAYLLNVNGFASYANILYSIRFNDDVRQELLLNMLKVSVYEFILREKVKHQNSVISTNIFSRRNSENKSAIDKRALDNILKEIEESGGF